jgi:hypothetical protein
MLAQNTADVIEVTPQLPVELFVFRKSAIGRNNGTFESKCEHMSNGTRKSLARHLVLEV